MKTPIFGIGRNCPQYFFIWADGPEKRTERAHEPGFAGQSLDAEFLIIVFGEVNGKFWGGCKKVKFKAFF
ncbi:MAG: hypothetical protein LBF38_12450 [Deltaproteobacteria bacterium]|jgi:hypothetical protein|nr:hypothetical protein [Deltaproteobacteria bacterium]